MYMEPQVYVCMYSSICHKNGDDADTSLELEGWDRCCIAWVPSQAPAGPNIVFLHPLYNFFFPQSETADSSKPQIVMMETGDDKHQTRIFMNQLPGNCSHPLSPPVQARRVRRHACQFLPEHAGEAGRRETASSSRTQYMQVYYYGVIAISP
jgi:hypothetical protein